MLPDGGRPHAFAVAIAAHHAVARVHGEAIDHVTDDCPMDEVGGLQNGNAGNEMEGGGDEIVVDAVADDVGVGVIGEENGVVVNAFRRGGEDWARAEKGNAERAEKQITSELPK